MDPVDVPIIADDGTQSTISVIADNPVESAREAIEEQGHDHIQIDKDRLAEYGLTDTSESVKEKASSTAYRQFKSEVSETVDRSGPTPDEILEDASELFQKKNSDYGDAWRLAGETMAMWAAENDIDSINPQNEQQMVSLCLYIQRLHKLLRGFNLEFGGKTPDFESASDSHEDNTTYAAMHAAHTRSREQEGD